MKQIVYHLVPDPTKPFGEDVTVYSCQLKGGEFVRDNCYQLGNGNVILFPCHSCNAEIIAAVLSPLYIAATKDTIGKKMKGM